VEKLQITLKIFEKTQKRKEEKQEVEEGKRKKEKRKREEKKKGKINLPSKEGIIFSLFYIIRPFFYFLLTLKRAAAPRPARNAGSSLNPDIWDSFSSGFVS
jgi:hypothetical protein